ncbi:MAG: hypothetical protein ABEI52_08490, partial [Halobacteriaceae archaeon]
EEARAREQRQQKRVDEFGRDALEEARNARRNLLGLLDKYEGEATGSGNFEAYIQFQDEVIELVENLPDDIPERERFEKISERFDKRRLSTRDFEWARNELDAIGELTERIDDLETAREDVRNAERKLQQRIDDLTDQRDRLRTIAQYDPSVLNAPVDELRELVTDFNDSVVSEFNQYIEQSSMRDVLMIFRRAARTPFLEVRSPPDDLVEFAENH